MRAGVMSTPLPLFPGFSFEQDQADRERLQRVHDLLQDHYGPPPDRDPWDPLTQLIYSMLSSRTRTETSHAVLHALEQHFSVFETGSWDRLRDAPENEVLQVIAPVTFPEKKAVDLQMALRRITRQNGGELSLDFFFGQPVDRIRRWLETFDGVGAKTSASVVNFSTLRMRALAVDSHHDRIAKRLGFVPPRTDPAATEQRLLSLLPEPAWTSALLDSHHSLIKLHGQRLCTSRDWERSCARCPLLELCPTGAAQR